MSFGKRRLVFFEFIRCAPRMHYSLRPHILAAERRPTSLEIVTLDDRLAAAAQKRALT
jgi:hypothetical protein